MYSDSNREKREEEKRSVLPSCEHCSSASHDPADTALTQEESNQVQLLWLLMTSNCAFSQQQITKYSGMGLSAYLLVELLFPLQLLKVFIDLKVESQDLRNYISEYS